ncbi:MAG TPA: hypothetical protein VGE53_00640 [Candidatus Paceibacterota bacterium]
MTAEYDPTTLQGPPAGAEETLDNESDPPGLLVLVILGIIFLVMELCDFVTGASRRP